MKKQNLKSKFKKFQIKDILMSEERIFIPTYQRAYSWEVKNSNNENREVAILWEDINSHIKSKVNSNFYLGNFIFEEDGEKLGIIDGQQRLTTIILLLSALKNLSNSNLDNYDLNNFSTVSYDVEEFRKIITEESVNIDNSSTDSIKKIFNTYNFFKEKLIEIASKKSKDVTLDKIKNLILDSTCQINIIDNKIEAIQVFVFENNRGKTPTNLEITKSMFMHYIYSTNEEFKEKSRYDIIKNIETIFSSIYKNIAILEGKIKEDFILGVAFRIYNKNLKLQGSILTEIENNLKIEFIENFLEILKETFTTVCDFIKTGNSNETFENEENYLAHSLLNLGIPGDIYPIILKAIQLTKTTDKILLIRLYKALEAIIIRGKIIDTSAKICHRLNGLYKEMFDTENTNKFIEDKINDIIFRIEKMINSNEFAIIEDNKEPQKNWWWSYWTMDKFEDSLNNGARNLGTTKYILWKYENYLRRATGKNRISYHNIKKYEVEHIAPKTENEMENNGYPIYDKEFYSRYLHCFGNLLLLKASINNHIKNTNFKEKLSNYEKDILLQSRKEILLEKNNIDEQWTIDKIVNRENKIKQFIKTEFQCI